ncbi:NTP/NDP exchange transporter [Xanthomonas hortorum]|uniref:MFS transporter n=1 Tax=Xanthomonas hortorum pv. pelargonii TaxID=453602 RepID=A0A6V7CJF0_9XANT|nr:MFS transporter [Xanthomonas hortorum]MCE4353849.1 MFS transporter [Xanthomonas hortorum pv. pelargonii]MCM5526221.1 MFS transporter [Xanthomonas hortorum pv. pelargonii]MCM5535090.1 MFS transporter [Xanthomonas hortorum pv. pelargonii]MCM5542532.1 MFS transporter [Xanthomonas hortorum pv. pelargonii]MCM5546332.1 MFS transporter [Xanthomonas hortorum pv. pelargonii]
MTSRFSSSQSAAGRLSGALRSSPPLAWSFLYFFCLLSGYYVLRPVREAMSASADVEAIFPTGMIAFFAAHGMPLKDFTLQVLFTCTFLIMVLLQPVYGALVSRYPRRVFLPVVYGFFIATLLLFYVLFDSGVPGRGMAFFLWVTVFNLFAVAVFWSFMADVFSNAEARSYYGYIGAAGTLGAFLGPILTRTLVERIGIAHLMLVSAGFLTVCVVCVLRLRLWAVAREQERQLSSGEVPMGGNVLGGLKLIVREPLLRWLAFMVLFGVGVGTLLYNEQAALVRRLYTDAAAATAYYASIDLAINALTLVLQLLVTRALLSRFGIGPALLIPGVAITLGYAVLTASPLPMMIAIVQVITRSSEFALAKPARETLYTRVDREWRYKAGAAIDTVIYRGGDLTFVWVHKLVSAFGSSAVFGVGLLVASGMTLGAFGLLREARKLPAERDAQTVRQVSD